MEHFSAALSPPRKRQRLGTTPAVIRNHRCGNSHSSSVGNGPNSATPLFPHNTRLAAAYIAEVTSYTSAVLLRPVMKVLNINTLPPTGNAGHAHRSVPNLLCSIFSCPHFLLNSYHRCRREERNDNRGSRSI